MVEALFELKEPYRSALLLRYYRDLSPTAVAETLGLSVETVKTRLKRGLAQLRERLDRRYGGDRKAWCLSLAPVAGLSVAEATAAAAAITPLTIGALAMTAKVKAIGTAALLLTTTVAAFFVIPAFLGDDSEDAGKYSAVGEAGEGRTAQSRDDGTLDMEKDAMERVTIPADEDPDAQSSSPAGAAGLKVTGLVTGLDGSPIAGARVKLWINHTPFKERDVYVHTDQSGAYAAELPRWSVLSPLARETVEIEGRAGAAGHLARVVSTRRIDWANEDVAEARLDFILKEGACLRGRVLDEQGNPHSAAVWYRYKGTDMTRIAAADWSGWYEMEILEKGDCLIYAVQEGRGISKCFTLPLDPSEDSLAPDLVIRGSAELAGTAIYPDGKPVEDFKLVAFTGERGSRRVPDRLDDPDSANFENLTRGCVSTDDQGRFTFSGLAWGSYHITGSRGRKKAGERGTYGPFEAGERNATVVLDIYRMRIRAVDQEGRPVPRTEYTVLLRRNGRWQPRFKGILTEYDAERFFDVNPGERYWVQASVAESHRAEAFVNIEEGIHEAVVDLVLKPPKKTGSLLIAVIDSEGRPVRPFHGCIKARDSDVIIKRINDAEAGDGQPITLPEGDYRVEIDAGEFFMSTYYPMKQEVSLVAGRTEELTLTARQGGMIRFRFEVPPDRAAKEIELGEKGLFEIRPLDNRETIDISTFVVLLENGSLHLSGSITPDHSPLSPLLEPGAYSVFFKVEGYLPVEKSVFVSEGEVKDLDVLLISE